MKNVAQLENMTRRGEGNSGDKGFRMCFIEVHVRGQYEFALIEGERAVAARAHYTSLAQYGSGRYRLIGYRFSLVKPDLLRLCGTDRQLSRMPVGVRE